MIEGLQGELVAGAPLANDQVVATPKHFLADGGTFDGKDQGDARIGEAELIASTRRAMSPRSTPARSPSWSAFRAGTGSRTTATARF